MTIARPITQKLAALLEVLELEQPRVVSRGDLQRWGAEAGVTWPVDVSVRRLRDRGWLLDLKTRGVWEFAPASRAGAFAAGDPLIELRAVLRRNVGAPFSVAADSAAYLLGYASRRPVREVIGAPPSVRVPPALRGYRLAHWLPRTPSVVRDALPVWGAATLLAFMATRPALYGDWPNVGDWLHSAALAAGVDELRGELAGRPRSAWARAAYLVARGGREDVARALLAAAPQGRGPYYLGDRSRSGRYDAGYDVSDSTGFELADS
jgi:hypothetical protein